MLLHLIRGYQGRGQEGDDEGLLNTGQEWVSRENPHGVTPPSNTPIS